MPKIVKPLTDKEIKAAKPKEKQYKLSDGQSLYLIIKSNGTKFFRFDFKFENKRKSMSFGVYPEVTLSEARILRDKTKELLKQNINPILEKNISSIDNSNTFKNISEKWLSKMKKEWIDKTYVKVENVIRNHAYPYIGNKLIEDITRTDILNIIDRMNTKGLHGSAEKMMSNFNRIYKYAVTYNYVEHNIIADIDKKNVIISTSNNHMSAIIKEDEIKELLEDISNFENLYKASITTIVALKLAPYVALRPYNLRTLEWSEVDFEKKVIDIPSEKMKTKKDFILPLSKQAIEILKMIEPFSAHKSKYVFPSPVSNLKCLSDATLGHALKKLGYQNRHTTHGFRSTFSTIAHEKMKEHGFNSDIIESCLAHEEKNKIKAAYNRASKMKYFEEKKELMQWWANWLDKIKIPT
ncbi:tyrosine-type recombinase/integrase [Halarcobacter anaerophilus]|uniref:tyrosine-type recombinase/integrase n=1 Tax=Halarcobacter anaerophilus TaxID=877500 RepID=UPI0005C93CF4|nr:integrase arm-type DNA-binding domain-containing protein [Halarcobacter anaerophilus]